MHREGGAWEHNVASLRSLLIVRGDAACHASAHFIIIILKLIILSDSQPLYIT